MNHAVLRSVPALWAAPVDAKLSWQVFIEGFSAATRVGIYASEKIAVQPVELDIELSCCAERLAGATETADAFVDYESYCDMLVEFLAGKKHTDLLETLAAELAWKSFGMLPILDAISIRIHKPKFRKHALRVGVAASWTRADFERLSGISVSA